MNITREQTQIANEILAERNRQDRRWGGAAHDDRHDLFDWLRYIDDHTKEAARAAVAVDSCLVGKDAHGEQLNRLDARRTLIQIAALAMAAVESQDRKHRLVV